MLKRFTISPFLTLLGGSGNMFGGGSFSAGGQTIGQTGFSSPAFQNKPGKLKITAR